MRDLDSSLADQLVELAFADTALNGRNESILVTGIGDGTLIERLLDSLKYDATVTAIDNDYGRVTDARELFDPDALTIEHRDFLDYECPPPGAQYDRILLDPPIGEWDPEKGLSRTDLAQYRTVDHDMDPDSVDLYLPFLERAVELLRPDGRLVAITPPRFTETTAATPLHRILRETGQTQIEETPVDEPAKDRYVTVVDGDAGYEASFAEFDRDTEERRLLGVTDATVADIMVSLADVDTTTPDADVNSAYLDLDRRDYDVTLVVDGTRVQGYLARAAISNVTDGVVDDHAEQITSEECLETTTSIKDALDALAESGQRYIFAGTPDDVRGQLTRFDLNERPVYLYLYSKLSDVELGFRQLIRQHDLDWETALDPNQSKSSDGELFDAVSKLQFRTLVDTLDATRLPIEYGFRKATVHGTTATLGDLIDLRNDIAHFHPLVQTMYDNPPVEQADAEPRTAGLLAACDDLLVKIRTVLEQ